MDVTPTVTGRPAEAAPPLRPPQAGGTPRPHRARTVRRALAGLLLLVVLAGAWVGFRAWQAATALQDARRQLTGVDLDAAALTSAADLTGLHAATSRAATAAEDPVWRLAEHVPWLGDQLAAVRVVATSLDDVVAGALPAADDLAVLLDGGARGADGRFDLAALGAVATRVADAAGAVSAARERLDRVEPDALVVPLAGPVRQAQDAVDRLDRAVGPAARVAGVLPAMLGADGPRTYLVLALNPAELRAAGGIVGAVVEVRVDDGAVDVVAIRTTADLRGVRDPVLPLTDEERALWGDGLGRWVQNASSTPDFPRTAALVAAHWATVSGDPVDGVLGTDPVAVAALVDATGPVPDPDGGALAGDGLVRALLRDAYVRHPGAEASDAYFAHVASNVVAAVGAGQGDPQRLLAAGRRAVDERRLRVWSARADEQRVLVATVAGGAFTSGPFADDPGLFLDDATQGKLGAYLDADVTFRDARCVGPDPSVTAVVRLHLEPPGAVASALPVVVGAPGAGVAPGTLLTSVSAWSGRDGEPLVVRRDGAPATGRVTRADGRVVVQVASRLAPGATQELAVDLPLHDGAVTLWTTPTVTSPGATTFRCPS